jgi:D-serine deaminase-like pyridoxal phosphate-dependent protein
MEPSKDIDWKGLSAKERLPFVVVDVDAFDRNVEKLKILAQSVNPPKKIRLATKSIRVPALIRRALDSNNLFQGLMCYSAEEIGFLAKQGFNDFLLAYPTLQNSDLKILHALYEEGKKICVVVDCVSHLQALSKYFVDKTNPLRLIVDVDASLRLLGGLIHIGVRRSPIRNSDQVIEFIKEIRKFSGLRFSGLMVYEAQVAGLGDQNPFKKFLNPLFHLIRKVSVSHVQKLRQELAIRLQSEKIECEIFNGGGTGSFNFAVNEPSLTEVTAGSALFCSSLFDYYSNISFDPSCYFVLQAVRSPDPGTLTCQGGGYIASGEPGWDRLPVPAWPAGISLFSMEGAGEVQTPVLGKKMDMTELGGPVVFRHAKAGELAERFNEYLLVSRGKIIGREKTYRGYGLSFF